jgi:flagellar M-ring protein FliF
VEDGSTSSEASGATGVSVQNELPEAAAPAGGAGGNSKTSNRTEETVNYEISKTVRNHVTEAGSIKRLSVAVLVDGATTAGADGAQTYQPRTQEEIDQIAALVRSAVGFDAQRGDTVEVVNMPFTHEAAEELAEDGGPPLGLMKSDFMRIGEMVAMIVVALLISLLVLRPLMVHAFRAQPAAAGAAAGGGTAALAQLAPGQASAGALPPASQAAAAATAAQEAMIDVERVDGRVRESAINKVGEIVDKHPDETLNIIRNWMYEEA